MNITCRRNILVPDLQYKNFHFNFGLYWEAKMKENGKKVGPLKAVCDQTRINVRIEKAARRSYPVHPLYPTLPPQPSPPTRYADKNLQQTWNISYTTEGT